MRTTAIYILAAFFFLVPRAGAADSASTGPSGGTAANAGGGGGQAGSLGGGHGPGGGGGGHGRHHGYTHGGHYNHGVESVQNFALNLNNAMRNPLDTQRRLQVDAALKQMNSAIATIKGDIQSGQVSPEEVQQVQQGLTHAMNEAKLKTPSDDASAKSISPDENGAKFLASERAAIDSLSQVTVPSPNAGAGDGAATDGGVASGELVNLANFDPANAVTPNSVKSDDKTAEKGTGSTTGPDAITPAGGLGFLLSAPGLTAPASNAAVAENEAEKQNGARPKSAPTSDAEGAGEVARQLSSARDDAFGIEVRQEGDAGKLIPVVSPPKKVSPATLPSGAKPTVTVTPVLHGLSGAIARFVPTSNPEDGGRELSGVELIFGWSRVALLGFIVCIPLFLVFFLLGTTARRGKKIVLKTESPTKPGVV